MAQDVTFTSAHAMLSEHLPVRDDGERALLLSFFGEQKSDLQDSFSQD